MFDWGWRLTLRARGVRVGVGLRGVRLRGLRWWLSPRRGPILWHIPGVPRTPGPAPRSPASTRCGPIAPWSGRCRPTCDYQSHKICHTIFSKFFINIIHRFNAKNASIKNNITLMTFEISKMYNKRNKHYIFREILLKERIL